MAIHTNTALLVLLPGLDGTGFLFDPLLLELSSDIQPHIICYPNHQFMTNSEQVHYIQTQLPNQPYFLLAESYSGNTAIRLAAEQPSHLQGLILSTTFANNPRPSLTLTHPLMRWLPLKIMPSAWLSRLLFYRSSQPLTELLTKALDHIPTHIMQKRLQSVIRDDSTSFLHRISVPTLILQGRHDYLVPKKSGSALARMIKNSTYETLDGGHGLLQDNPQAAAKIIIEFMRQHHRQR